VNFVKIGAMKFTFAPTYFLTSFGDIPYRKSSSNGLENLCHEIYPDLAVQIVGQLCSWFIHCL